MQTADDHPWPTHHRKAIPRSDALARRSADSLMPALTASANVHLHEVLTFLARAARDDSAARWHPERLTEQGMKL
jgi:hypothetical protein